MPTPFVITNGILGSANDPEGREIHATCLAHVREISPRPSESRCAIVVVADVAGLHHVPEGKVISVPFRDRLFTPLHLFWAEQEGVGLVLVARYAEEGGLWWVIPFDAWIQSPHPRRELVRAFLSFRDVPQASSAEYIVSISCKEDGGWAGVLAHGQDIRSTDIWAGNIQGHFPREWVEIRNSYGQDGRRPMWTEIDVTRRFPLDQSARVVRVFCTPQGICYVVRVEDGHSGCKILSRTFGFDELKFLRP